MKRFISSLLLTIDFMLALQTRTAYAAVSPGWRSNAYHPNRRRTVPMSARFKDWRVR
ncbi:MAG: hypothetical protein HY288_11705 [Planctomycetia bacterium]|nr:hypothetical protein [Planctomycetia bacterium]